MPHHTSRDIRTRNRHRVLRHLLAEPPASRARLAAATGLSPATVANVVGELSELGLLRDAGAEDSHGGRPRRLLAVDPSGGALVGVDVAETYVHAEVFDLGLDVLSRAEAELRPGDRAPATVVARVADTVRSAVERAAVPPERVLGVGVSMPGVVDRAGGVSVYASNWDWHRVPLRELLAEHLPYRLHLDNPLRACTLAELWFGAARGREDAVVVNLGTGVGAGLALGGDLYRGTTNSAGEWGHTTLVPDGRRCHCGGRGCVEAYVGAPGIMRTLRDHAPHSPLLHPDDQTATIAALAAAHATGDATATAVVDRTAQLLGTAVADLVNLLDPEVVVLSSWVSAKLGPALLPGLRAAVAGRALPRPRAAAEIVLCPLRANPVSLGAAAFALEGALAAAGRRDAGACARGPAASPSDGGSEPRPGGPLPAPATSRPAATAPGSPTTPSATARPRGGTGS